MRTVLAASRYVVCPTRTDRSSLVGLANVANTYGEVLEDYNPHLEMLGSFTFGTSMVDGGKPFAERRAEQEQVIGGAGAVCPHGIPFVEKVGNAS
ncbi:ParA family protein, partial [Nocardia cyriacigeorgica]|uniref:ParA family protein n=1 Tax=Nocardia cyriacigeorgica TaxID=135487 RepID=UPI001E2D4B17